MMTLLLDLGPWLLGGGGVLVLVVLGGWLLLGPGFLFNKWFMGAIAVTVLIMWGGTWLALRDDRMREVGAAAERALWEQVNKVARAHRKADIAAEQTGSALREDAMQAKLQETEAALDAERKKRKGANNVTAAANAACSLTNGVVWDHNAAVPKPAGSTAVPPAQTGSVDGRSGVALRVYTDTIDANYTACAKLVGRVEAANVKRYADCVEHDRIHGTTSNCVK